MAGYVLSIIACSNGSFCISIIKSRNGSLCMVIIARTQEWLLM